MCADRANQRNPFPGLRPFKTDEGQLFFGCAKQRNELLRRLKRHRLLALLGTSGSGKSSLVRAGLIPALRHGVRTRDGSQWRIAICTPGNDPLRHMATALSAPEALGNGEDSELEATMMETTLRRSALGLIEIVRQARVSENLLILIDQFEELFRLKCVSDHPRVEDPAAAFVRLFLEAAQQEKFPIYILLTMRSDYLGDCVRFPGLPEAISNGQYLIPRLTREQLAQVIVEPINAYNAQITPRLIHRLLNDAGDNPDQLPILQHALMRTWDHWIEHGEATDAIDLCHYEAIGTMAQALEWHANEAMDNLPMARHREIAERIFKRLTEKGPDNREVRHPTTLGDLCAVTQADTHTVVTVLDAFRQQGRSFLMPDADYTLDATSILDISHESLIRVWQPLKLWVEEESQAAATYRRLAERAREHKANRDHYLQNPALQLALNWRERYRPNAAWALRYDPDYDLAMGFLAQSDAAHQQAEAEKEAARSRELEQARALADEQQHRLDEQQRYTQRLSTLGLGLFALLALVIVGMVFALTQRNEAQKQHRLAIARERTMQALKYLDTHPKTSVALALYAAFTTYPKYGPVIPEAHDALNRAVERANARPTINAAVGPIADLTFAPDGQQLAVIGRNGAVNFCRLRNCPASPVPSPQPESQGLSIAGVDWGPQGLRLMSSDQHGVVTVWQWTETWRKAYQLEGHQSRVASARFSADSKQLISAGWDRTLRAWEPTSGHLRHVIYDRYEEAPTAIAFSPDGTQLASASWAPHVLILDPLTASVRHVLPSDASAEGHTSAVSALVFSPDGQWLASAGWDGLVKVWDTTRGKLRHTLRGHHQTVQTLAFSPDGAHLASAGWDGDIKIWSPLDGTLQANLTGRNTWATALAFSPDSTQLAAASEDGTILVWQVRLPQTARHWQDYPIRRERLILSPDGTQVAAISQDHIVDVQDVKTGRITHTFTDTAPSTAYLSFSVDGRRLAIFHPDNGELMHEYYLPTDDLIDAALKLIDHPPFDDSICQKLLYTTQCPSLPTSL